MKDSEVEPLIRSIERRIDAVETFVYREDVDYPVASKRVLSESFHLPPTREAMKGTCVFAANELPEKGTHVRFFVRPIECYGHKGRAISSGLFMM